MTKLTLKQKRFADEYIISGNATQAAIKAGYSRKTANRIATENLSKPVIKEYIEARLEALESNKIASQEEVLQYLTSVMRGETVEPMAVLDGGGTQKVVMVAPNSTARNKAAELLGKRYRIFTDKQEVELSGQVVFNGESDIED